MADSAAAVAGAADSEASVEETPAAAERREAGRWADDYMDELKELVEKLESAYSGRLVSVILYGSAAAAAAGDHHRKFSDLNVLCVLKEITPRELADGEPVMQWWREQGHPSPLLMCEEEAHQSADCFPSNSPICRTGAKCCSAWM